MKQNREYQTEAIQSIIDFFYTHKEGNPLVAMPTGCHAKGHGIMLSNGEIKPVEEIEVGDELMGPDSKPRTVLQLCKGRQEMRKVIPNKGESFIVNLDHKLNLTKVKESNSKKFICKGELNKTVTIREYEESSKWFKHIHKLRRVPINLSRKKQPLDPYFIGLLIGDGSLLGGSFNLTTPDIELAEYFKSVGEQYGLICKSSSKPGNKASTYRIVGTKKKTNPITKILAELGMMGKRAWEKSIPKIYKLGSRKQRLELLAGLIDSDGYIGSSIQYVTTSKQLAEDIVFLIRSVGLGATNKEFQSKFNGESKRLAYSIQISGNFTVIPFKRKRHIGKTSNPNRSPLVTGFKTEELPEDDYYGFELDGDHLYLDQYFIVHHNTGKSHVIAGFIHLVLSNWPDQRILNLTHVKELIEQSYSKLVSLWPAAPAGIYSAGLKRKEVHFPITFAGVASVVNNIDYFARTNLIIIDEADLVSPKDETMYMKIINRIREHNPRLRVIGLTATPWRSKEGSLINCGGIFTHICYDATGIEKFNWFLEEGYLVPLVPKPTETELEVDVSTFRTVGGEFNQEDVQKAVDVERITRRVLEEAADIGHDRKKWLIFCAGIQHCVHVSEILDQMGIPNGYVHSHRKEYPYPHELRGQTLEQFKHGHLRAVSNNSVLSVGYDEPGIDLIIHLKPMNTSRRWVQELGRGTRTNYAPGYDLNTKEGRLEAIYMSDKRNCMVLDYGRNTERLGPINDPVMPEPKRRGKKKDSPVQRVAPVKVCPNCTTYIPYVARECFHCGYQYPEEEVRLENTASEKALIATTTEPVIEEFPVDYVTYKKHTKANTNSSTFQITYYSNVQSFREFIPIGSERGRRYSNFWWHERTGEFCPDSIDEALKQVSKLKVPVKLRVWTNKQYPEIVKHIFQ